MKTLEVMAIGLEEISVNDMRSINGGINWVRAAKKIINFLGCADLVKEFRDGWNEASDSLEFNWE